MTRTYCLGSAPDHINQAYDHISDALQLVEHSLQPGKPLVHYHNLVCDHFEKNGYPTLRTHPETVSGFFHGLGHGLGVEMHELPSLGSPQTEVLSPGMVFTIEPGLYFPDDGWGIRLEDVFAIHQNGSVENLVHHPKQLVIDVQN